MIKALQAKSLSLHLLTLLKLQAICKFQQGVLADFHKPTSHRQIKKSNLLCVLCGFAVNTILKSQ